MPSKHQTNAGGTSYDSDAKRYLATKNDLTLSALIDGMRRPDRVDEWVQAEIDLADSEDRDPRRDIIGALNRKKRELQDNDN